MVCPECEGVLYYINKGAGLFCQECAWSAMVIDSKDADPNDPF